MIRKTWLYNTLTIFLSDSNNFEAQYNHHLNEFQRKESKLQQEIDRLKGIISKVIDLVPDMLSHLRFTQLCKTIGFGIEMIRQLINGDEVRFNGDLYSELHDKRLHTDGSVAKRYQSNDRTENAKLLIDNKPHDEWFREQHQNHSQTIEPQQRRGRRMYIEIPPPAHFR